MDRDTLKRVLRYIRQRKTVVHKEYVAAMGKGKTKASQKIEGRLKTYSELIAYIEKLLKDIPDATVEEESWNPLIGEDE